jgi:hypothetical protein
MDRLLNKILLNLSTLSLACQHDKKIKELFDACNCKACKNFKSKGRGPKSLLHFLAGSVYSLLDYTCCNQVPFKEFQNKFDDAAPRMIQRACADPYHKETEALQLSGFYEIVQLR